MDCLTSGILVSSLNHAHNPGFKIDLYYRDLGLIMEAGRALNVPLPITARAGLDHSGGITLFEDLANVHAGKP
jgi:hypothetical protein